MMGVGKFKLITLKLILNKYIQNIRISLIKIIIKFEQKRTYTFYFNRNILYKYMKYIVCNKTLKILYA